MTTDRMTQEVWYVAYGSSMDRASLHQYLRGGPGDVPARAEDARDPAADRGLTIPHALYFAGSSRRWGGAAVAFVRLTREAALASFARAYLISRSQLDHVCAQENGVKRGSRDWPDLDDVAPGQWIALPVTGKYDALLRLDDVEGRPAFTLTTSRPLERGDPSEEYTGIILRAVAELSGEGDGRAAASYLSAARLRTAERAPVASLTLDAAHVPRGSPGYVAAYVPRRLMPRLGGPRTVIGTVATGEREIGIWLEASKDGDGFPHAMLPPLTSRALHRGAGEADEPLSVKVTWPLRLVCHAQRAGSIADADVIQVTPRVAARLGRWALLVSETLAAPVRVEARDDVESDNEFRLSYAGRVIWSVDPERRQMHLQRLDDDRPVRQRFAERALLWVSRSLEGVLGAPPVVLRATEGVVGDDGRRIVRLPQTALDLIGANPGDEVVVSWAGRCTRARALAQTDEMRETMSLQLEEQTGHQVRRSTVDPDSRARVPPHLQAWVASAVRSELEIPPDAVVRVRRNLTAVARRQLTVLPIALVGFVLALTAVEGIGLLTVIVAALAFAAWSFVPLYRSRR